MHIYCLLVRVDVHQLAHDTHLAAALPGLARHHHFLRRKGRVVRSRPNQSQSTHTHTRHQHNLVAPNPRPRRTLNASKSPKAPSVSRSRWEIGSSPDRCGASSEAGVSWSVCQQSARQSAAADLAQLCAEGRHVELGEASGDVLGNVSLEQSRVLSEARRAEQVSGRVSHLQWSVGGTGGAGGRAAVRVAVGRCVAAY